jgi:hypothetical protein
MKMWWELKELVHKNRYITVHDLATEMRKLRYEQVVGHSKSLLHLLTDKQNHKCVNVCHNLEEKLEIDLQFPI